MTARRTRWTDRRTLLESLIFAAALISIVLQLFFSPFLSVADEGDFQKLAGRFCLGPDPRIGREYFDYANLHWVQSKENCTDWPYRSSAELVIGTALGLNRMFGPVPQNGVRPFDLRWVGLVYSILFLALFAWIQRLLRRVRPAAALTIQIAFVIAVCNAVYIPLFSTFFFDTVAIVALIGVLAGISAMLLGDRVSWATFLITGVALLFLAASKSQHALLAVLALPALWIRARRAVFPPAWARALGSAAVLACVLFEMQTIPPEYVGQTTFNALFFRVLPQARDPQAILAETSIPATYGKAVGSYSYQPGSLNYSGPSQAAFARMFGPADLARLYLRHPALAWQKLLIDLDEASRDRVRMKTGTVEHRLGNYERNTGKPPQTLSQFFCAWPALKRALFAGRPRLYLIYILAVIAAAWWLRPRMAGSAWLLGIVTATLGLSFAIGSLDGVESGRHLQLFNFQLDLAVCAIAGRAAARIAAHAESSRPQTD